MYCAIPLVRYTALNCYLRLDTARIGRERTKGAESPTALSSLIATRIYARPTVAAAVQIQRKLSRRTRAQLPIGAPIAVYLTCNWAPVWETIRRNDRTSPPPRRRYISPECMTAIPREAISNFEWQGRSG